MKTLELIGTTPRAIKTRPMTKQELKALNINGYKWTYSEGKLHAFQKGTMNSYYIVVRCFESEIHDGSLERLIELGATR